MDKKIIQNLLREQLMGEDYPVSFNMDEFKKLTSFSSRVKYSQERLSRLSSGSSRIAYKIDNEKVLKLAKNNKGIAQNKVEIESSNDYYLKDLVAKIFNYENNGLWLEMELATKLTTPIFKDITGFNFKDYQSVMLNHYANVHPEKRHYTRPIDEKIANEMWEEEFIYHMLDFIGSYNVPVGDLIKLSSLGVVHRETYTNIVIIDYGFNDEVASNYYS